MAFLPSCLQFLPFTDLIEWDTFALVIPASEVDSIPARVSIASATMERRMEVLSEVQHMFTYDFTVTYIENVLRTYQSLVSSC